MKKKFLMFCIIFAVFVAGCWAGCTAAMTPCGCSVLNEEQNVSSDEEVDLEQPECEDVPHRYLT